ncbi:hypothetical protein FMUBM48_52230 [Nocardia cyriacigeorgica]|nr:hypothetical protein FMUBM48_52230 [Nocardia cyriacigeorgica]
MVGAAVVVVGFAVVVRAEVACGATATDVVVAGALVSAAVSVSESALDNDIAPSPAKTMASAISTIASARSGIPPEVGFG